MKVGIIGLGLMGSGMAKRLIDVGYELAVYNRSRQKAEPFSYIARLAANPKELAEQCDIIITIVTDFGAAKDVLFGTEGVVAAQNKPIIVDASTIAPSQSAFLAKELTHHGIEMLGMPVMGGPSAAETGELIPMVAGSIAAFEKAKPIIETLGKQVFYIGNNPGSANAVKLALNMNIALIAIALSEGIALARSCEIDPGKFVQILNATYFKTGLSEKKGPKMIADDFAPSFHLKNMLKDLDLASNTAQERGITIPVTSATQQIFRAANNSGFSELDYTAICAFLAKVNGMQK